MAPVPSRIYDLAAATLAGVVAHWPVEAVALPDRQFVTNGLIIWDGCEQLAVSVPRTATASEGDPTLEGFTSRVGLAGLRFSVLDISLLRCVPDLIVEGNIATYTPSPAELEASALVTLTDAQSMWNAVQATQRAGELVGCGELVYEGWAAAGPEGGMGGGVLRVRAMDL